MLSPCQCIAFLHFSWSHSFVYFGWEVGNKQLYYLLSGIGRAYLPSIPCPPWKRTEFLAPFNGSRYLSWGNCSLIRLQIMVFLLYTSYLWDFFFFSLTFLMLRGNAQMRFFQVKPCMLSKSTLQLITGASGTISMIPVVWTLYMEPQGLPPPNLSSQDFLSPDTWTMYMEWGQIYSLATGCSYFPLCTEVYLAFELFVWIDANHFIWTGKMECKVPRDWLVNSCPTLRFITLTRQYWTCRHNRRWLDH